MTKAVSIENYKIQIFIYVFHIYPSYICVGFIFSQPYTYILRAVYGDTTWCKVIIHSNCDQRQFALVHLSLEEVAAFVRQGFCNQGVSWSSASGWTEELCNQHFSQVGVLVTVRF